MEVGECSHGNVHCAGCTDAKVGLHQASVLSSLLFVTVMKAITRKLWQLDMSQELQYADYLILMAEN